MLNEANIIGRIGKTPEIKQIPSGTVANISVATKRYWKDKSNEWQNETEWHNVVVYGKSNVVEKITSGALVFVKGRIKTTKWTDDSGTAHKHLDIIAQEIKILDNKPKIADSLPSATIGVPDYIYDDPNDDNYPPF